MKKIDGLTDYCVLALNHITDDFIN